MADADEVKRAAHAEAMAKAARQKEEDRRESMKKATAEVDAAARKKLLG